MTIMLVPRYALPALCWGEVPVVTGPQDPAAAGGDRLRASRADREQVIEVLKDAFVQGRLTRDELDARAGRALAARIYAELAVLTADIPAGPADAAPARPPARAQNRVPQTRTARNAVVAWGFPVTAVIFMVLIMLGFYERSSLASVQVRQHLPRSSSGWRARRPGVRARG
jgi:Domain of unknown function (DUF1707)